MRRFLLLHKLTDFSWNVICRQFWLLAVLSMLFLLLPLCVGPVAQSLLAEGVDFSGMTLAVCVPEGDDTGELVEELTGKMRDISRYAKLINMSQKEAMNALESGEITAVLLLPDQFVTGILYGENPDVTVIVRDDKPIESLLTVWVGQSAVDLLSAAQKGIYTVLEIADQYDLEGIDEDQLVMQVNLEYIRLALNRQNFFQAKALNPTGSMDILTHYGLSLIIFLMMSMPPVFRCLFSETYIPFRRRLQSLGCGTEYQLSCCWSIMFFLLFMITILPVWLLAKEFPAGVAVLALFGCAYCSFCCLLMPSAEGCGLLSLVFAAVNLFLSGGILPSALLPEAIREIGVLSPVTMLRSILYLPADEWGANILAVGLWILLLMCASCLLFRRKLIKEAGKA